MEAELSDRSENNLLRHSKPVSLFISIAFGNAQYQPNRIYFTFIANNWPFAVFPEGKNHRFTESTVFGLNFHRRGHHPHPIYHCLHRRLENRASVLLCICVQARSQWQIGITAQPISKDNSGRGLKRLQPFQHYNNVHQSITIYIPD